MKKNTCCFIGNRPEKLPWGTNEQDERCLKVKEETKAQIISAIQNGYEYFISSLAIGYDMMCAELVLALKKEYPQIKLIGVLQCKDQEKYWTNSYKERYNKIMENISTQIVVSREYNSKCIQRRNQYMVSNSSLLIALYDGKRGGVQDTINFAKSKDVQVQIINN